MDPGRATVIAAAIGAVASVAVAFVTTRARISDRPKPLTDGSIIDGEAQRQQKVERGKSRKSAWALVGLLYLMAAVLLYFGLIDGPMYLYNVPHPRTTEDITEVSVTAIAGGFFAIIAFWAQRRLQRSRRKISN
jgi:hypothetical protein